MNVKDNVDCFICNIVGYSLILLVRAGNTLGTYTYQDTFKAVFGVSGFIFAGLLQLIFSMLSKYFE